jgi:hypothetical protein
MSAPVDSVVSNGDSGGGSHPHHWMIEGQNGPSSDAVCKECGERRNFLNGYKRGQPSWIHWPPLPKQGHV